MIRFPLLRSLLVTALLLIGSVAHAAALSLDIVDEDGNPLANAVAYAMPKNAKAPSSAEGVAVIDQIHRQFVPLISVVRTGTSISFPNKDNIRHHVYSFSPPKTFELRLYSGVPANPVVFDNPGLVVLGCNIHDQMVAYVRVVDTPWFAKSDASGKAVIENLPAGEYEIHAWHYRQADINSDFTRTLRVDADTALPVRLHIKSRGAT